MTQSIMIQLLLFTCGLATATNFVLSILGFTIIFDASDTLSYVICVVLAFTLLVLKLCTEIIKSQLRNPRTSLFRCLWLVMCLGTILDLGAVSCAVILRVVGKQPASEPVTVELLKNTAEAIVMSTRIASIALIFLFVGAPIAFSFLLRFRLEDYEGEKERKEADAKADSPK
jgi:hypothetical protein